MCLKWYTSRKASAVTFQLHGTMTLSTVDLPQALGCGTVRTSRPRGRSTRASGWASGSRLTNTKPGEGVAAHPGQAALLGQSRGPTKSRSSGTATSFTSIDLVGPRVVLAAKATVGASLLAHDRRAPVLARVVEAAHHSVGAAHHQQRDAEFLELEVVARLGNVLGAAGHHPHARPQVFLFEVVELLGDVARRGDVVERREALGGSLPTELVVHLLFDAIDERLIHVVLPVELPQS